MTFNGENGFRKQRLRTRHWSIRYDPKVNRKPKPIWVGSRPLEKSKIRKRNDLFLFLDKFRKTFSDLGAALEKLGEAIRSMFS